MEDTNGGANGEDEVERILTEVIAFRRGFHLWFFVDVRSNFFQKEKDRDVINDGECQFYPFML